MTLYFNHNNILKKYKTINKETKDKVLDYCSSIKYLYKDDKKITTMLDKIALDIQKLINKGKLSDQDLNEFIKLLKDNDFGYLDCYQIINSLLILSKHNNTIFGIKFNFFGINKTNHIYEFIHNKLTNSNLSTITHDKLIDSSVKGILKINIGIVYSNPNVIRKGIKNLHLSKLLLTTNSYKKHPLEKIYQEIIDETNKIILIIEQNHPNIYAIENFTTYLYELLAKPIPAFKLIEHHQ